MQWIIHVGLVCESAVVSVTGKMHYYRDGIMDGNDRAISLRDL